MAVKYKQKCVRCKKNYVTATWKDRNVLCYECEKAQMEGEIDDPKMKKMFDIPEEFYRENGFLRNIKVSYLKFGGLTEKQVEAFKKTVAKMKEEKKSNKTDTKTE